MRRIAMIAVGCLVIGACTSVAEPGAGPTPTTTAALPTTSAASVTEAPTTSQTTTTRPTVPQDDQPVDTLAGRVVSARWVTDGILQQYFVGDRPTGWFGGPRFPLAWEGDNVSHWLAFAEIDGAGGNRGPYEDRFFGAALLLETEDPSAYPETFTVLDLVPVEIGGAGLLAAMCPDQEGVPQYAALLQFFDQGLTPIHRWEPRPAQGRLVSIDQTPAGCASLPTAGTIVTQVGAWHAVDEIDRGRLLDIGSGIPERLDWWEFAGSHVNQSGMALLLTRNHAEVEKATARQAWLGEMLGWDYGGFPLRLIHATLQFPTGVSDATINGMCRQGPDGPPAVAITEDPCSGAAPTQAWLIDVDERRFVETDPSEISCDVVCGD